MKNYLVLFIAMLSFAGCTKSGIAKGTPKCVQDKIVAFNETAPCANGVKVTRYIFQGKYVYVFNQGDCGADFTEEVIDDDCNTLGYLGGITGNTEINGENFSAAKEATVIWSKN